MKSSKCIIVWKPNFEILNPKTQNLKSLTLKSQNCQNWIKNHPKSKFLTVEYLRIRFCIDIFFQIFSKFVRSWLDKQDPNLKFQILKSIYQPNLTKIHQNWLKSLKFSRKFFKPWPEKSWRWSPTPWRCSGRARDRTGLRGRRRGSYRCASRGEPHYYRRLHWK